MRNVVFFRLFKIVFGLYLIYTTTNFCRIDIVYPLSFYMTLHKNNSNNNTGNKVTKYRILVAHNKDKNVMLIVGG
jgi:hypothetical protein